MTIELKQQIRSKLAALDAIPYINQGGCGLVAEMLYDWLRFNDLRPTIIILEDDDPDSFRDAAKNNDAGFVYNGPSHVVVKVGRMFVDSTGLHRSDYLFEWGEPVETPIELLQYWNRIPDYWNFQFDRHKYLKEIKTIIWQGTQLSLDL